MVKEKLKMFKQKLKDWSKKKCGRSGLTTEGGERGVS